MFALPNRVPVRFGALALAGLAALSALAGCKVSTQLGESCSLVRKPRPDESDGGTVRFVRVKNRELPVSNTDYISFGAVECDDLTCVLDADSARGLPDEDAQGYCTEACAEGQSACEVTDEGVRRDNPELVARMTCRNLILDEQTLSTLRAEEPELYRRSFGENASSGFCAGARVQTDAGTP
jgi:hypothetical protein